MDYTPRGTQEPIDYQSYLLRLWRVNDGEKGWRASLESADTGERKGFANLEAMFGFLRQQIAVWPDANFDVDEDGRSDEEERR